MRAEARSRGPSRSRRSPSSIAFTSSAAFPALEDQLCTYEAGSSDSPDRLDAMVWAFTELMLGFEQKVPIVAPIIIRPAEAYPAHSGYGRNRFRPSAGGQFYPTSPTKEATGDEQS